jgi:quercetin dioxygenase-like cupin family protein
MRVFLRAALVFAFASTAALAQDAVKVASDHYKVLVDNAHVRVIENTLKPGEKDEMHTHPSGWFYVRQSWASLA